MNRQKEKITMFLISIFVLSSVTIMGLVFINKYQSVEAAKQLTVAIQEYDLVKVEKIVQEHSESVNTLPSMSPWWWQLITEQPEVCFPLQTACWIGNYDIVKLLVDNDADVNLVWKGIEGSRTSLIMATSSNSERTAEIVELLLEHGADKSAKDSIGNTAYDYAMTQGDLELAELLMP